MKTNYSLERIKELDKIATRLIYKKRDNKYLSTKEYRLFNKIINLICMQRNRLALAEVLR